MKLGELLMRAGKITPAQLEETLKGQAVFGGRFGTNLVEMGYLDEHDLAHFLSKKLGVPHASPEQLMDVPPQVLRLIPPDAVRKYRVMPVALNNRKLTLAMADPSDFSTIDEISFVTGYIVIPIVTPELRLVSALEKHYNIKRDMRYICVEGGMRSRAHQRQADGPETVPEPAATGARPAPDLAGPDALSDDDIFELPLLAESECFGDLQECAPTVPGVLTVDALHREADYSLATVLEGLTRAEDRNGIAELIVNHAAQTFHRSALLLVKAHTASGWVALCGKAPAAGFAELEIPLSEPSVLKVVAESKACYLGPIPVTPGNSRLMAALGGGAPGNNLLVPLLMMGRVVAILYVAGERELTEQMVADLQRLVGKGSLAFEILILKNKILSA